MPIREFKQSRVFVVSENDCSNPYDMNVAQKTQSLVKINTLYIQ